MSENSPPNQPLGRRKPVQERSAQKLELILEAATRLIDEQGLDGLTTNRIAERAGISIGTLYQYFSNKRDIVAALGQRELKAVTAKMIALLTDPQAHRTIDQPKALIHAVFGAFGGRSKVHRVLLENALAQGAHALLQESPARIASVLSRSGIARRDGTHRQLSPAEAFVLTQAFTGVIRAAVGEQGQGLPREQIEAALVRLIHGFLSD